MTVRQCIQRLRAMLRRRRPDGEVRGKARAQDVVHTFTTFRRHRGRWRIVQIALGPQYAWMLRGPKAWRWLNHPRSWRVRHREPGEDEGFLRSGHA